MGAFLFWPCFAAFVLLTGSGKPWLWWFLFGAAVGHFAGYYSRD